MSSHLWCQRMLSTLSTVDSLHVCPHNGIIILEFVLGHYYLLQSHLLVRANGSGCQVVGALEWTETQRFCTQGGERGGIQMARDAATSLCQMGLSIFKSTMTKYKHAVKSLLRNVCSKNLLFGDTDSVF